MSDEKQAGEDQLPPRLSGEQSQEGDLVRRYLRRPHGASEPRAWFHFVAALPAKAPARRFRAPRALALIGAGALVAVSLLLLRGSTRPPGDEMHAAIVDQVAPPTQAAVPAASPAAPRSIALGARAQELDPGRWTIVEEASLELGPGSAARAGLSRSGAPVLALARGRIALAVVHKPRPTPFRVSAGRYQFTVLGTTFTVERAPDRVDLVVSEGQVAVSMAGRRLAVVSAGGSWSSGAPAPAARDPREASVPPECTAPGSSRPGPAALPCLRAQAAGDGLRAQIALFHIGRINQEDLREPAGALATFEELRRRFPAGPLRAECDLSIVQLLAAAGRHGEALEESAALLARRSSPERAAELRLLRGNLYREALDLTRAEYEYRQAAELGRGWPAEKQAHEALLRLEQTSGTAPGSN
jgi:ferric-dicitrate binding protein FerR (iron transport regulator)